MLCWRAGSFRLQPLAVKEVHWDNGTDMHNEMVYNGMQRNHFVQIMWHLHSADNTSLTLSDKLANLRPLMKFLKTKFLQPFQPVRQLSYDKRMIEYYGSHGCKQFMRGKSIRSGYQVWCLNTKNGYLANFEVYQGKQTLQQAHSMKRTLEKQQHLSLKRWTNFRSEFVILAQLGKTVCRRNAPSLGQISSNARPVGTKSTYFRMTG